MRDNEEIEKEAKEGVVSDSSGSFEDFAKRVEEEKKSGLDKIQRYDFESGARFLRFMPGRVDAGRELMTIRRRFGNGVHVRKMFGIAALGVFAFRNYFD